jgi:hypothetical protein
MNNDKKLHAKELFKNYTPEILEYDADTDGGMKPKRAEYIPPKNTQKKENDFVKLSLEKRLSIEEMLKDYKPEILVYDPEVDGSDEHLVREEHLSTKEALVEKIRKAKAARKNNQTTFRQNIRTENEVQ